MIDFCTLISRELVICMHIIRVVHSILCRELRSFNYKRVHSSNWHLPLLIQQLYNNDKFTLQQHYGAISPLFKYYVYIIHFPSLTTFISLLFETGKFWCRGEGHLLGNLRPIRPGPNLFYVGKKEKPGCGTILPNPGGEEDPAHSLGIH